MEEHKILFQKIVTKFPLFSCNVSFNRCSQWREGDSKVCTFFKYCTTLPLSNIACMSALCHAPSSSNQGVIRFHSWSQNPNNCQIECRHSVSEASLFSLSQQAPCLQRELKWKMFLEITFWVNVCVRGVYKCNKIVYMATIMSLYLNTESLDLKIHKYLFGGVRRLVDVDINI